MVANRRDRFRIVRIPAPRLVDLPLLAASIMEHLGKEDGERTWDDPLAVNELHVTEGLAGGWLQHAQASIGQHPLGRSTGETGPRTIAPEELQ
jgi:hypothetical protein